MDRLESMRALVAVIEAEGFSAAARKSGRSKALLSKQVAQLEEGLGVRLLNRTTRQVSATAVGQAYYERALPLLAEFDELEARTRDAHAKPSGRLRVSAPVSFSELHLMAPLAEFSAAYPAVEVELSLSDRNVDLINEGFDLALRIGELADSSLVARPLAPIRVLACASPDWLSENGLPTCPADLQQMRCVLDGNREQPRRWAFERDGDDVMVEVGGALTVNSAVAVRELLLGGAGIGLCPSFVVGDDLRAGRLQQVLPAWSLPSIELYAIYPHRRHLSTKVRLFVDALRAHFGAQPSWDQGW
jgi:DNA-binding transcriptional LysR family regulator